MDTPDTQMNGMTYRFEETEREKDLQRAPQGTRTLRKHSKEDLHLQE